jgi:hypothetical protein
MSSAEKDLAEDKNIENNSTERQIAIGCHSICCQLWHDHAPFLSTKTFGIT